MRERRLGTLPPRSAGSVALIAEVGESLDRRRPEIAKEIVDGLRPEIPEFVRRPAVAEEFLPVVFDCLTLVHAMARSWSDPHNAPAPESAIHWARSLAAHGLPNIVVLRAFRLGQAIYQDVWFTELQRSTAAPELLLEALQVTGVFVSVWVDAITQSLLEAYEDERERQLRGAGAIRAEALRQILDGSLRDERAASLRLGYELGRSHQALVMWTTRAAVGNEHRWTGWSTRAVEVLVASGTPLVVDSSPGFVLGCGPPRPSEEELVALVAEALDGSARIALGTPHPGLAGLRQTISEARRAHRAVALLRDRRPVVRFDQMEALDLVTQDLEAGRAFVHRVLGTLAAQDALAGRLRATVAAYHDAGLSFAGAGRRLGIHENSVASRLQRASALAGQTDVSSWEMRIAIALTPLIDQSDPAAVVDSNSPA